jgi:hypothetical protein
VGVDPSIFSTGLMAACKQIASLRPNEAPSDKETALSSKDLLVNAYGQLAKQPKLYPGVTFACRVCYVLMQLQVRAQRA